LWRWDRNSYSERSVEDLKERYYSIAEKLERIHGGVTAPDQVGPLSSRMGNIRDFF
jgi:hypothetical protein